MAEMTPQEARRSFKLRQVCCYHVPLTALSLIALVQIVSLIHKWPDLSTLPSPIGGIVILAVALLYAWQFLSDKEGPSTFLLATNIQVFCPHCGKDMPRLVDWRCGYCDAENKDQVFHPIIYECKNCEREPKSYICCHCDEPIFFDADKDARHPARVITGHAAPKPDLLDEKKKAHLEKKTELQREIEIAALKKELTRLMRSPEFQEELSALEKLAKKYSEHETKALGFRILERKKRAEYLEQFGNDPAELEDRNMTMDDFLLSEGLTPNRGMSKQKGTGEPVP